jgi:HEPN domain-containing protein
MNERIKELTEQAEIKFEAHPQHSGIVTAVITPADLEKFAELIVQECLMKAIGAKIRGESIDTLIQNIKEDFGVEE